MEFDTGEVLSQAKQDWVNKLDGHGLQQLTQIQRQAYNKTVSHDNNMHNIIFETDSQEEMSTMNKTSKYNTKYKQMNHSNFRVTAQGFQHFLQTDFNELAKSRNHSPSRASRGGNRSAKPTTSHSSLRSSSRERSELVKFDAVKDKVLPKFTAKVIMDTKLKFKARKMNSLAMQGILPPKPRKKAFDDVSDSELFPHTTKNQSPKKEMKEDPCQAPMEKTYKFSTVPELPPRYGARFGTTLNIKKIRQDADHFNAESRDFISTIKGNTKMNYFSSQSPLRKAGESVMSTKNQTSQSFGEGLKQEAEGGTLASNLHSASMSNLRSGKFNSIESLKTLSKIKQIIQVAREPSRLNKLASEPALNATHEY